MESVKERIFSERIHGKSIKPRAELIWGWSTPAGKQRIERRIEALKDNAQIDSRHRVLELGCGTGLVSRRIAESCKELIAIDISDELLAVAKEKSSKSNIQYLMQDIHAASFEENSFDAVIGSSILHHLEINRALREIYRLLKPGGHIAFTEPNMLNPQIVLQKNIIFIKKLLGDSVFETAFTRCALRRKLQKAGFKRISITPFDFLHPFTPKPLIGIISCIGSILERIPLLREIAGSLLVVAEK